MKKFREREDAGSSVIGVVLLVGLAVVMVSTIALSVFAFGAFEPQPPAPQAKIEVVEAKGGLPSFGQAGVSFEKNTIQLKHKGGDSLDIKNTKIIITGRGQSHTPCANPCPYVPPHPNIGNVQVIYLNLTKYGKINKYNTNNPTLQDGFWAAGEYLLLSGADSLNSNDAQSSVWVIVDGNGETSNNYGFKVGERIYITIIDTITNQIISTTSTLVRRA